MRLYSPELSSEVVFEVDMVNDIHERVPAVLGREKKVVMARIGVEPEQGEIEITIPVFVRFLPAKVAIVHGWYR